MNKRMKTKKLLNDKILPADEDRSDRSLLIFLLSLPSDTYTLQNPAAILPERGHRRHGCDQGSDW